MPSLAVLLKKLEALHRQHVEIEHQIASVKHEIVADSKPEPKRRRRPAKPAEAVGQVRALVKVLRDAGEPLPLREIVARLDIPRRTVGYHIDKAIAARFVEKVGHGRYRATNVVPAF